MKAKMQTIKNLFLKYKELISYVFFGALTTLVNFVTFWVMESAILRGENAYLVNNIVAWFASVSFAYVTNKLFVFNSRSWEIKKVAKEVAEFFSARVLSFLVEEAGLWLLIDALSLGRFSYMFFGFEVTGNIIAKIILSVIVVMLNYFFSKLWIFKKK